MKFNTFQIATLRSTAVTCCQLAVSVVAQLHELNTAFLGGHSSSLFTSLWIIHLPAHPSHFLFFHLRINQHDRYLVPLVWGLITQAGQKTFFSLYESTRQLLCRFWLSEHKIHLSKEKVSVILYSTVMHCHQTP